MNSREQPEAAPRRLTSNSDPCKKKRGAFMRATLGIALLSPIILLTRQAPPACGAQEGPKTPVGEYPAALPRQSAPTSQPSPSSPSNASPRHGDPLLSILSGEWRPAPFYVDTGPFAAAEEHAYWTRTGAQFVVITNPIEAAAGMAFVSAFPSITMPMGPVQEVTLFAGYCWPSLVRLETGGGHIYPPLGEQNEKAGSQSPHEIGEPRWKFKVNPGEALLALHVERPKGNTENCPNGEPSRWLSLGTDHASLSLVALPSLNNLAEVEQHSKPVRLGQLEITVTAVGLASGDWDGVRFLTPNHGHHDAVVSLAIKNASEYPNCTMVYGGNVRLFDTHGFEYPELIPKITNFSAPRLLPGEGSGDNVRFHIWDRAAPRVLIITRSLSMERWCVENQHRPVDMHGGTVIRIPIKGVPVISSDEEK